MKKLYLLFFLIISFSCQLFCIEFSRNETYFYGEPFRIFPNFMYFKNSLLFGYDSLSDFSVLSEQKLIPIYDFENEIRPKIKYQIFLGGDTYRRPDNNSLIERVFAFYDDSVFLAYEIKENNKKITKQEISKDEFNKLSSQLHKVILPEEIALYSGYSLKLVYGSDDGKWPTYFQITDLSGNVKYDFREMFPYVYVRGGMFAVNEKNNKIAFVVDSAKRDLEQNAKEYILVELCIIYDGVCNDDKVRLRSEPNLNCETIRLLNKGEKVKIKDRTDEEYKIDKEKWYWYQVELSDGKIGWVYGKYLDIEK